MTLVLGALVVVAALAAFGYVLARSSQKKYAQQHELIPGTPSDAPAEWAGAHTPEARMHRRLGDAIRGVRATAEAIGSTGGASDARLLEMRVELEQQALQVDNQLIAAAQLPGAAREKAMQRMEQSVAALEAAAGDLSALIAGGAESTSTDVQGITDRIRIAGEVQRELDALDDMPEMPEMPDDTPEDEEGGGTLGTGTA